MTTTYSSHAAGIISVLADRVVGYHVGLAKIIGVKEAVFLSQLLYLDGKGARKDGWIWKSHKEMEDETGLSRTEQDTVRKHLAELGIVEQDLRGVPATIHYKINFESLGSVIDKEYPSSLRKPRNQVCGNPANWFAETPQTIPENTTENTTQDQLRRSDDETTVVTPDGTKSSGTAAIPPTLVEDKPGEGSSSPAAPRRPRVDAGNGELYPHTPGGALLFSLQGREAAAKGLSAPQKFPSVALRDKFLAAEERLGMDALRGVILMAIEKMGYVSLAKLIQYISKAAGNSAPDTSNLPQGMLTQVATALRYNLDLPQHIPRISRLTESCLKAGYTEEQVRKAGRLWWEKWPGNTGTGPGDAQLLQAIETVKKERL